MSTGPGDTLARAMFDCHQTSCLKHVGSAGTDFGMPCVSDAEYPGTSEEALAAEQLDRRIALE